MTLAEKDKLDEVLEYFRLKSSELKMAASETLEDEIKELQDILKFAQKRVDAATGETKDKIQQVIDFTQQKVDELKVQADLGTAQAKDIAESLADEMDGLIDDLQRSDLTKKAGDVAKSVGNLLGSIGKRVGKGASDLSKTISIRAELSKLNNRRRDLITQIGESVYKGLHVSGSLVVTDDLVKLAKEVESVENDINNKKAELAKVGKEENLSDEQISKIIEDVDKE